MRWPPHEVTDLRARVAERPGYRVSRSYDDLRGRPVCGGGPLDGHPQFPPCGDGQARTISTPAAVNGSINSVGASLSVTSTSTSSIGQIRANARLPSLEESATTTTC